MRIAVIDTCCLINLYASRRLSVILAASIEQGLVPGAVLSECLYIRQPSEENPNHLVSVNVDLRPFIVAGDLIRTELTGENELAQFVQLAVLIDDCEAACLAVASVRGLPLATDDKRAIQVATGLGVPVVTTPLLVKNWAERVASAPPEVADAIVCIERYGRFRPHDTCPYAEWWADQKNL
jgi:predicted nucleic acid-binding protein